MPKPRRDTSIAAHAAVLSADAPADGSPNWVQLMPAGAFAGRDGRGPYDAGDQASMSRIVANTLRRAGATELVVDYDHQSIFGAIPDVGGRAPAAGWIKELAVRPDGIYGRVEWTAAAAAAIRAGEYRYLSPVYQHDKAGKVLWILHAGLTNVPNLDLAAVAARTDLNATGDTMEPIAKALGLPADASEAAIIAAIGTLTSAHSAIAAAAGLAAGATSTEIVTAVQSARTSQADPSRFVPIEQVTAIQSQLNTLQASLTQDKASAAVDKAIEEGKLAPAMRDWGLSYAKQDLAGFTAFASGMPAVVTPGGRPKPQGQPAAADLTDTDIAVQRAMGLPHDAFVAARKKEGA